MDTRARAVRARPAPPNAGTKKLGTTSAASGLAGSTCYQRVVVSASRLRRSESQRWICLGVPAKPDQAPRARAAQSFRARPAFWQNEPIRAGTGGHLFASPMQLGRRRAGA